MNDICLVRAREGDPCAREEMAQALRTRMVRLAAHYARCCQEDADDLLQEAWAGLLEALQAVDLRIGDPEQYLLKHARWRLLDAIRRARIRRCSSLEDHLEQLPGTDDDLLTMVEMAEFVSRLKPTQREVLACLLAGLTWREAGCLLGCSSANVAYHVRQIRTQYELWCRDRGHDEKIQRIEARRWDDSTQSSKAAKLSKGD